MKGRRRAPPCPSPFSSHRANLTGVGQEQAHHPLWLWLSASPGSSCAQDPTSSRLGKSICSCTWDFPPLTFAEVEGMGLGKGGPSYKGGGGGSESPGIRLGGGGWSAD